MAAEVASTTVSNTSDTTGGTYYDQFLHNEEQDKLLVDALLKKVAEQEVSDLREVIEEYEQLLSDAIKTGNLKQIQQAEAELEEVKCETTHFLGYSPDKNAQIRFSLKQIQAESPIQLSVRVLEFDDNCDAKYMQHVNAFLRLHAVQIEDIKDTKPTYWGLTHDFFDENVETITRVMNLLDICHAV
jgi:hypothetical protein